MKRLVPLLLLVIIVLFSSCVSKKQIVYLQDVDDLNGRTPEQIAMSYALKVQQGDILNIKIAANNQEVLRPFGATLLMGQVGSLNSGSTPELTGYRVDDKGNINLPILGETRVEGFTCKDINTLLSQKLTATGEIKDPIINTTIANFKVSILGAVRNPGDITVTSERFTLLQALSRSGDLTVGGMRKNVLVVREQDGQRTSERIDLTSADLLNSPYYYLRQNDVIYVEPNASVRVQGSPYFTFWNASSGILSLIISVVSLVNVLK